MWERGAYDATNAYCTLYPTREIRSIIHFLQLNWAATIADKQELILVVFAAAAASFIDFHANCCVLDISNKGHAIINLKAEKHSSSSSTKKAVSVFRCVY